MTLPEATRIWVERNYGQPHRWEDVTDALLEAFSEGITRGHDRKAWAGVLKIQAEGLTK